MRHPNHATARRTANAHLREMCGVPPAHVIAAMAENASARGRPCANSFALMAPPPEARPHAFVYDQRDRDDYCD
jgi:hypothetical protein